MYGDEVVLEMKKISKSFGKNKVLNNVDLTLHRGEVLGLIGENGAGKSTLIKILCGIYKADQGEIMLNGVPETITDVSYARKIGISAIYQELSLFPDLNAVENIFINHELKTGSTMVSPIRYQEMRQQAKELLEGLNTEINVDIPVRRLKLAQKQIVEIARTLFLKTQVIIMDEPTAALEENEREQLFLLTDKLKRAGHSIIFISHHLDELTRICDRLAILRDGQMVDIVAAQEITTQQIVEKMIGKPIESQYPKTVVPIGEELLSVDGLTRKDTYYDIKFSLHRGEILGIVGVEGCGKNEIVKTLFGCMHEDSGEIRLHGETVKMKNVQSAMRRRIAYVPAERKTDGLFLIQPVTWNTTIAAINQIQGHVSINRSKEKQITNEFIKKLSIKCKDENQEVVSLSGGNQQKIMLARWIMTDADIFLLEEPTRGIDVNAKTEVYSTIGECVRNGKGVIIISSEEEEVLGICDKILVMNKGLICAVLDAKKTSAVEIKSYAVK